jgi:hypothetical protein
MLMLLLLLLLRATGFYRTASLLDIGLRCFETPRQSAAFRYAHMNSYNDIFHKKDFL